MAKSKLGSYLGIGGKVIGTVVGSYFGGPVGGQIGGMAGTKEGENIGDVIKRKKPVTDIFMPEGFRSDQGFSMNPMMQRSLRGSKTFNKKEVRKGYRKLKG